MIKRILLSAVGGMPSISYIKHLQSNGYFVIGIDSNKSSIGFKFCDEFYTVPTVSQSSEYIKAIQSINFDVFFPWLDEEHILFSSIDLKEVFPKGTVITSSPESIRITTNKNLTYDFCIREDIPVARKKTIPPVFVRKIFSRGSKGARLICSKEELEKLSRHEIISQEPLSGLEYTVDILILKDIFIASPRSRIKSTNVSTLSQIDLNKDIIEFCRKVCSKLDLYGPINIQLFKLKNGEFRLIEINPRLAGTSILSIKAGFDLLCLTIESILKGSISKTTIKDNLTMQRYYCEKFF